MTTGETASFALKFFGEFISYIRTSLLLPSFCLGTQFSVYGGFEPVVERGSGKRVSVSYHPVHRGQWSERDSDPFSGPCVPQSAAIPVALTRDTSSPHIDCQLDEAHHRRSFLPLLPCRSTPYRGHFCDLALHSGGYHSSTRLPRSLDHDVANQSLEALDGALKRSQPRSRQSPAICVLSRGAPNVQSFAVTSALQPSPTETQVIGFNDSAIHYTGQ